MSEQQKRTLHRHQQTSTQRCCRQEQECLTTAADHSWVFGASMVSSNLVDGQCHTWYFCCLLQVKVIGVETVDACAMTHSLEEGMSCQTLHHLSSGAGHIVHRVPTNTILLLSLLMQCRYL